MSYILLLDDQGVLSLKGTREVELPTIHMVHFLEDLSNTNKTFIFQVLDML